MQKIIYTKGLPASGKSTWAKEIVDKEPGKWKRINKDDLRDMLDNSKWSKDNEKFILSTRDDLIKAALLSKYSVIVDDTNFDSKHQLKFFQIAVEVDPNIEVECKDFTNVSVHECLKRDASRSNSVGADVIMRMYNQYLAPTPPKYAPPTSDLPKVIICDLDGTLADTTVRKSMRLMFDASRCDELDTINEPVLIVINSLLHAAKIEKVIFMSGRMNKDRSPTLRFLSKCGFDNQAVSGNYMELHMRNDNDTRQDAIIKHELFNEHIHGKYDPILWLDDRQQVVDMARNKLGITVFQVAEGLF